MFISKTSCPRQLIALSLGKVVTVVAILCILSSILDTKTWEYQRKRMVTSSLQWTEPWIVDFFNSQQNSSGRLSAGVQLRFQLRRQRVRDLCHGKKESCSFRNNFEKHQQKFYDYNTTVCPITKAGSSTWRTHLRLVNKGPPVNLPINQDIRKERFLKRSVEVILEDILSTSRIITVRHPLTRLVSSYRDDYLDGAIMYQHRPDKEKERGEKVVGSKWDEKFHQFWLPALSANNMVPSDTHIRVGLKDPINPAVRYNVSVYHNLHDVLKPQINFTQFLTYVIKTLKNNKPKAQWMPYDQICCPCFYDYEFITKIETMTEDLEYIFNILRIPADPATIMNQHRESISYVYGDFKYFQGVPLNIKKMIYKYYKPDIDMFSYQLPDGFLEK